MCCTETPLLQLACNQQATSTLSMTSLLKIGASLGLDVATSWSLQHIGLWSPEWQESYTQCTLMRITVLGWAKGSYPHQCTQCDTRFNWFACCISLTPRYEVQRQFPSKENSMFWQNVTPIKQYWYTMKLHTPLWTTNFGISGDTFEVCSQNVTHFTQYMNIMLNIDPPKKNFRRYAAKGFFGQLF